MEERKVYSNPIFRLILCEAKLVASTSLFLFRKGLYFIMPVPYKDYLIQRQAPEVSLEFYTSFSHQNLLHTWSPTSLRRIYMLKVVGMNGADSLN